MVKEKIPRILRNIIYEKYISDKNNAKCYCCSTTSINPGNFNVGHIISEKNGGKVNVENLRPICGGCNSSMGTQNMHNFMKRYGFWELKNENVDVKVKNHVPAENVNEPELHVATAPAPRTLSPKSHVVKKQNPAPAASAPTTNSPSKFSCPTLRLTDKFRKGDAVCISETYLKHPSQHVSWPTKKNNKGTIYEILLARGTPFVFRIKFMDGIVEAYGADILIKKMTKWIQHPSNK